jgi:hypothetical protein
MHIAELNVGRLRAPVDHPLVKEFIDNLDRINALAERMPGFVWRLTGGGNNATDLHLGDDPTMAVNLSVWETVEQLETYVFGTLHAKFYQRRREWFELMDRPHFVLWHVPQGHRPTLAEAGDRLAHFQAHGPSDVAFGWAEAIGADRLRRLRCA